MKITVALFSYGGVVEQTVDALLREFNYAGHNGIELAYHRISGDALIPRSRSRCLGKYREVGQPGDAIVMVDHDTDWRPGDLCHIAQEAAKMGALVGGLYSKRCFGKGWASRVPTAGTVEFGKPNLIETNCLATGFMAIPYDVIDTMINKLEFDGEEFQKVYKNALDEGDPEEIRRLGDLSIGRIRDGAWKQVEHDYYDFFRCTRIPSGNTEGPKSFQFISEDWAFSQRCVHCGIKSYLSTFPILTHYGEYGFTIPDGMDKEALKQHEQYTKQKAVPNPGQDPGTGRASK